MDLSKITEREDSYEGVFAIASELWDKQKRVEFDGMTAEERIFLLVVSLRMHVENGGFAQFFYDSSGDRAPETLSALRAVGAERTAGLLERAFGLFPDAGPPRDLFARTAIIETWAQNPAADATLIELDDAYFEDPEAIEPLLIRYVKDHKERFFV